jgi:hypothetical protein
MLNVKPKLGAITAALLLANSPLFALNPPKLSGTIAGIVRDSAGIPQMGATVLLFNKYERLLQRALTNERGAFGFEALTPDLYSVRVSLASFMPAMKHKIEVQPGMQSLLYINLANMLSSIELVYAAPGQGALMSEDWKWTLKTATATRPILRFDPWATGQSQSQDPERSLSSIFSDTRGLVKLSAGDASTLSAPDDQQDLGTAFALATSLYGRNQFQVSGNVGYGLRTGAPAAGFRTTYHREGLSPEISVTVRQIYLPTRAGMAATTQDGLPALRSISLGMKDHIAITDDLKLEYGVSLDSVSFVDRLNYFSPFARFTYDLGTRGTLQVAYSSGSPPTELATHLSGAVDPEVSSDGLGLTDNIAALALLPRVSLRDDRVEVQRTQNFEAGYEKIIGSRKFDVSAYHEIVSNGAFTMMAPDGLFMPGDVLPDISSNSSIVNVGSYQRNGYAASLTQALGDRLEVSASFGNAGILTTAEQNIAVASADELRSQLRSGQRFWGSARASTTLPVTSTRITATYEWTDYSVLMPEHYYVTQEAYPEPGLNIHVRQPIPSFPGLSGRMEATVDLKNVMGQGYLPLTVGGQRVLMMQNPQALRGGLSFIF